MVTIDTGLFVGIIFIALLVGIIGTLFGLQFIEKIQRKGPQ